MKTHTPMLIPWKDKKCTQIRDADVSNLSVTVKAVTFTHTQSYMGSVKRLINSLIGFCTSAVSRVTGFTVSQGNMIIM